MKSTISPSRMAALATFALISWANPCYAFAPPQSSRMMQHQQHQQRLAALASAVLNDKDTDPFCPIDYPPEDPTPCIEEDDVLLLQQQSQQLNNNPPVPGAIMKMLPPDTWHVKTSTSLMYFTFDVLAVIATMSFLNIVVTSSQYHAMPLWEQALSVIPLQILTGFTMWCTWCIGHDAGHGTISKNNKYGAIVNRIVGEITHSVICLTPFVPWALSHRKHHLNHNHLEKDYSHQWYVREERENLHPLIEASFGLRMVFLPFLYFVYLVTGIPDGGHVFFYGRMWDDQSIKEKLDAAISVVISFVTAGTLWYNMGTADFAVVCMVPWSVMGFWLFMVTYLQHHSEDGKLYTDDTFTFERGAFETVDRDYGEMVNRLSHHMMDGTFIYIMIIYYKLVLLSILLCTILLYNMLTSIYILYMLTSIHVSLFPMNNPCVHYILHPHQNTKQVMSFITFSLRRFHITG